MSLSKVTEIVWSRGTLAWFSAGSTLTIERDGGGIDSNGSPALHPIIKIRERSSPEVMRECRTFMVLSSVLYFGTSRKFKDSLFDSEQNFDKMSLVSIVFV
jgi:hypothetical protein